MGASTFLGRAVQDSSCAVWEPSPQLHQWKESKGSLEDYISDSRFCATPKRRGSDENIPQEDQLASSAVGLKRSRKGGRCNLRKSLAWNPAFFTEEGVLDPSELSMISGSITKTGNKVPSRINAEKSQMILFQKYTGRSQSNNLKGNLLAKVQLRPISQKDGKKVSKLSLLEKSTNHEPRMLTGMTPSMKVTSTDVPRFGIRYSTLEKAKTERLQIEKDSSKLRLNSCPSSSTKSQLEATSSASAGIISSNIQQTHKFFGLCQAPIQAKPSALRMPSPSFGVFQQKKVTPFPSNEVQKASQAPTSVTSLRKPANLKLIAPSRPPVIQIEPPPKKGTNPTKVKVRSGKIRSTAISFTSNKCNHPPADEERCADIIGIRQTNLKHKIYSIDSASLNFQEDVTKKMEMERLSVGHKMDEKTQNICLMNTNTDIRKESYKEIGCESQVGNKYVIENGGMIAQIFLPNLSENTCASSQDSIGFTESENYSTLSEMCSTGKIDKSYSKSLYAPMLSMTGNLAVHNDARGDADEPNADTCKEKYESPLLISNTRQLSKSKICATREAGLYTEPREEETEVVGVKNGMEHIHGKEPLVQCLISKSTTREASCELVPRYEPRDNIQSCEFKDKSSSVKVSEYMPDKKDAACLKTQLNAVPFSEEWLAAIEAFGEDILEIKTGTVQNSPTDKALPEPSPWSPVMKAQEIGPFDCTKCIKK